MSSSPTTPRRSTRISQRQGTPQASRGGPLFSDGDDDIMEHDLSIDDQTEESTEFVDGDEEQEWEGQFLKRKRQRSKC